MEILTSNLTTFMFWILQYIIIPYTLISLLSLILLFFSDDGLYTLHTFYKRLQKMNFKQTIIICLMCVMILPVTIPSSVEKIIKQHFS
tara:strand:- start:1195 stop:1458 length:264 start_codon:yes stop_codon:yes gene_type:complete